MAEDNWKLLSDLIEEAGGKITFDSKRNITICIECGAKNRIRIENGQWVGSWLTRAPGYKEEDCRRLCDECAKHINSKVENQCTICILANVPCKHLNPSP